MMMMIHRLVCAACLNVSSAKQQQFLASLAHFHPYVSLHVFALRNIHYTYYTNSQSYTFTLYTKMAKIIFLFQRISVCLTWPACQIILRTCFLSPEQSFASDFFQSITLKLLAPLSSLVLVSVFQWISSCPAFEWRQPNVAFSRTVVLPALSSATHCMHTNPANPTLSLQNLPI